MFCSKCGTAVADQNKFCTSCGSPTSSPQRVQRKARGRKKWWFVAGGLVLLTAALGSTSKTQAPSNPTMSAPVVAQQDAPAKSDASVSLPRISAQEVANAYEENAAAADQTYLGRQFVLTGKVASINSGLGDRPYITFKTRNMFQEPQATFGRGRSFLSDLASSSTNPSEVDRRIAQLRKGQEVSLVCKGGSSIAGTPMFDGCAFVE